MSPTESEPAERLLRARLSLEGLSVGDAFGERFFLPEEEARRLIDERSLPGGRWTYTDDTMMAIGILETLERHGRIDQDALAEIFARRYRQEPGRGYGSGAHRILWRISEGEPWRPVARQAFEGRGSLGNGAAMRVAPLGAYFGDDLPRAASEARLSAEVTHAHPEGQAGAVAIAVAAALAGSGRRISPAELLEAAVTHLPESETRQGIEHALRLPKETRVEEAAAQLGNGSRVTAPDTVPFALWCASRTLHDFQEALWLTVSGLGDRDTTCAMVGGIVALSAGLDSIPPLWLAARESLPAQIKYRDD